MIRLRKQFTFLAHLVSLGLFWLFVTRDTGLGWGGICLTLDAIALTVIFVQFTHLLRSYGSVFARAQVLVALAWGGVLSLLALVLGPSLWERALALAGVAAWGYVLWRFCVQKANFDKVGTGPLRADTWISPPAEALMPGDVLCTSGRVATWLHQSAGHTEDVIVFDGALKLFSSWFETGACINELGRICKPSERNHYYVLRRRKPLTDEQLLAMDVEARAMLALNKEFVVRNTALRERMPRWLKAFMDRKWPVTGYDWVGAWSGRIARDRWTCAGIHLTLMRRLGLPVPPLGSGLFGLGTGFLDFLNTEDLASDRGMRRLTLADKDEFDRRAA